MEGKKSFNLYTDLIQLVNGSNIHNVEIEPMTDEEAGKLFRWILEYVNDLHPAVPKEIKFAVVQVKKQLDDDLEKYKKQCAINQVNGAKGGRPKKTEENPKNPLGYLETEENPTKAKKPDKDKDKDKDINNIVLSNDKSLSNTSAAISQDISQAVIILPCLSNYQHPIFDEDVKHYKELYPAVDILQQFKNMLGWLESNPQNRKTKNGVKSFITRWLSRCQDKAPKVETTEVIKDTVTLSEEFKQRPDESYEEYKKRIVDNFRNRT